MVKHIAFLALAVLSHPCLGQETKLIITGTNNYTKEYYVLKSDEEVKHGPFLWYAYTDKVGNNINLLETGNYTYGKKDGQWDYFYSSLKTSSSLLTNNLWQRVVYKNGIKDGPWTSFHLDTIQTDMRTESYRSRKKNDSTVINLGLKDLIIRLSGQYQNDIRVGRWAAFDHAGELIQLYDYNQSRLLFDKSLKDSTQYTGTRTALFLGGDKELLQSIRESFDPHVTQYIGRDSTRVTAEFIIKPDGLIDQLTILKSKASRELQKEMFRILQATSGNWFPAMSKGTAIDSRMVLNIDVLILERKWNSVRYTFKVHIAD